jgi:hypothetical protein
MVMGNTGEVRGRKLGRGRPGRPGEPGWGRGASRCADGVDPPLLTSLTYSIRTGPFFFTLWYSDTKVSCPPTHSRFVPYLL